MPPRWGSGKIKSRPGCYKYGAPLEMENRAYRQQLPGHLFFALQEDEVLAELLGGDVLGGFMEVVGELPDAVPVGLLGALADGQELQVIGEGF